MSAIRFLKVPFLQNGSAPPPDSPTHLVSCGGGNRFCLGFYDASNESWTDFHTPAPPGIWVQSNGPFDGGGVYTCIDTHTHARTHTHTHT